MRRCYLVLAALLTAALVAGCSGLPRSSQVQRGAAIDDPVPAQSANYVPAGPSPGDSQKQIVAGFLDAGAGTSQNYERAREFLTSKASSSWRPRTVSIGEGTREPQSAGTNQVTVTAKRVALLSASGHLSQGIQATTDRAQFGLSKVNGQWRISSLPKDFGVWMYQQDFTRTYQPQTVYYPAATGHTLVPDTQWYTSTGLVSSLAAAVLRGPPTWMQGMTIKSLPTGSGLLVASVPVDSDGVATVDLTDQVLGATQAQRSGLWAAMIATLQTAQVGDVRQVVLEVDGSRLRTGARSTTPTSVDDLGYEVVTAGSSALIERTSDTRLSWTEQGGSSGQSNRILPSNSERAGLPTINHNWHQLAASSDGTQLAAVDGNDSTLGRWVGRKLTTVGGFGTDLVKPSFSTVRTASSSDVAELWVAGRSTSSAGAQRAGGGSAIWVIDTTLSVSTAQPQPVDVSWLGSRKILALKVAPEGTRVAIVAEDAEGHTSVYLSGIVRDSKGHARSLTKPLVVAAGLDHIRDVTWIDYLTLGVLGSSGDADSVRPWSEPIGQFGTDLGTATGAESIVATGVLSSSPYVVTNRNTVLSRVGAVWQPISGAKDLIAPGS